MSIPEFELKREIKDTSGNINAYELFDGTKTAVIKVGAVISAVTAGKAVVIGYEVSEGKLIKSSSNDSKTKRIHELVAKLNEARAVYEQGKDEIMTNFEYDKLYDELVSLEKETGIIMANSPTQNVGYEVVSSLKKVEHESKMLSLDKTKSIDSLASWLNGKEGVLSWKLDGLTVVLTYDNGKLVQAVTRGNGSVGEDVTNNAKTFKNLPKTISYTGKLVLRGEAIIGYSDFNKINSTIFEEDKRYKNPRNLCSGSVRQLDSKVTAGRNVRWYAFEVIGKADENNNLIFSNDYDEQLKSLERLGFETVERMNVTSSTIHKAVEIFKNKVTNFDIPSDGLVLAFKDKKYGLSLGATAKCPRHSIAFKWQDETGVTHLRKIVWQVGRSGIITPVAEFDPIDLEGTTVSRATLHNLSVMLDVLGQPYIGQEIEVYKANMIIPNVSSGVQMEDVPDNIAIMIPGSCPCCGAETRVAKEPVSGVLTLWCTNEGCTARGGKSLEHFVKRDCMNIDGISGAKLTQLVEAGLITDFASIYKLHKHRDEIVNLEGFGDKSFEKMINAIDKSREVKPHNLLFALGIPNIGLATAKLICEHFDNDLNNVIKAEYHELVSIDGIGDVLAQSMVDYFGDDNTMKELIALVYELKVIKPEAKIDSSMAGVTICVTGDVYKFSSRRVVKEVIEALGGKLTSSVSKSTTYLMTNDTTSGSNKNKKAKEYGIVILTEDQFIEKFGLEQYVR
jgi:DNA ligase (NAD+)